MHYFIYFLLADFHVHYMIFEIYTTELLEVAIKWMSASTNAGARVKLPIKKNTFHRKRIIPIIYFDSLIDKKKQLQNVQTHTPPRTQHRTAPIHLKENLRKT
jgi:hypothetical protein